MNILKELCGKYHFHYFFIPEMQYFSFRTLGYTIKTIPNIIKECSIIMYIIYDV